MPKEEEIIQVSVLVIVEKDGPGFYAHAPALKGLHIDGATEEEALKNAEEAIDVYFESLRKHGEPLPEGHGLTVHRSTAKKPVSLQHITMPWRSLDPSGINSGALQPAV